MSRPARPSACSICFVSSVGPPVAGGRRGAAQRRPAGGQCLAQRLGQLDGVAVAFVVHVHDVRRHLVEMIVDGGDLEPSGEQAGHDRRHFLVEQDEVAHDHGLVAHLLEGRVGPEREPRLDRDTLHGDGEIGPRHADAEDIARLELARFPESLLDGSPVGLRRARRGGCGDDAHERETAIRCFPIENFIATSPVACSLYLDLSIAAIVVSSSEAGRSSADASP